MRATTRAAILIGLLVLPAFALTAEAGNPNKTGWSPHDPIADVANVAISASGTTMAAALIGPFTRSAATGQAPPCAPTDLQVYDFLAGPTYAGKYVGLPAGTCQSAPNGRSHVATNAAGNVVASLGRNLTATNGIPSPDSVLQLSYLRTPAETGFAGTPTPVVLNQVLPATATAAGLIMSADGNRVVVTANDISTFFVRGYAYNNGALNLAFVYTQNGNATALAGDAALTNVIVGGRIPEAGTNHSALFLIAYDTGRVDYSFYDRRVDETAFPAAAMTRDGSRFAVGGTNGTLFAFENKGAFTSGPEVLTIGTATVNRMAVSGNGNRLAAAAGPNLTHFDYTSVRPATLWRYDAQLPFSALAYNFTGGILLAGAEGVGAIGLGDTNNTPFWTIAGANTTLAIDDAGMRAIIAQRLQTAMTVTVVNLTRQLSFEWPDGAETGAAVTTGVNAPARFELNVRNDGAAPERIRFAVAGNQELTLTTDPKEPTVLPGQSQRVTAYVTPNRNALDVTSVNLTAISLTSNARDNVTVSIRISTDVNVALLYDGSVDLHAAPGEPVTLTLGVKNDGNRDAAVGLRATQVVNKGATWSLDIDPPSFNLGPGALTTARVTITAPLDVPDGASDTITFALEGQNVTYGFVTVTLRVNPHVAVSIDSLGRARLVAPGESVMYNVTVLNNGTLPRNFELIYDVTSPAGRNFLAEVPLEPFRLEANAERTFTIRVFAPSDATADDRATILVTARSVPEVVNETIATSSVTLFANAAPKPTPIITGEGPLGTPAPGLLLTAAMIGLAVALRRRNSQ